MTDAPGFMMYRERGLLLDCLTDEQAGRVIKAIFAYADTGEVAPLEQSELIVFLALKNDVDRSAEKYETICERNRINGAKGGRPSKPQGDENPP